jgi:DNA-binding response OmpR family regulator
MNSKLELCIPEKMTRKRILVIDDNVDILTLVQYSLEDIAGWDVMTASSGDDGLVQARTEKPDAILLDGIIDGMDSFTFLQKLRNSPEVYYLPVILLTGSVSLNEHLLTPDLDVVGVITKPFNPILLSEKISQFLGWTIET